MKKIRFTMTPNKDGKIITNTLKYIMRNVPEIKVPDTDITKIPLADDTTKHCVDGIAEGRTWINGKCTQYVFTLIFK